MFGLLACDRNETFIERGDGAPLMFGAFESYATERLVRSTLASLPIEVLERSGLPKGDRRPTITIVTLCVPHYRHVGSFGELRLTLFNDRLMTAFFYPQDIQAYVSALKSRGIDLGDGTKDTQVGMIHVWMTRDFRGERYVGDISRRESSLRPGRRLARASTNRYAGAPSLNYGLVSRIRSCSFTAQPVFSVQRPGITCRMLRPAARADSSITDLRYPTRTSGKSGNLTATPS